MDSSQLKFVSVDPVQEDIHVNKGYDGFNSIIKINPEMDDRNSFNTVVSKARTAFNTGKTKPYEFRRAQLLKLRAMCQENGELFCSALSEDLRKSCFESSISEINIVINEVNGALDNLKSWMKPYKPPTNLMTIIDKAVIINDPRGVVLIIGAWNYPVNLALMPLVGVIAAGNCAILKPSENAPVTANLLKKLLPQYLDMECYQIVCGGVVETQALLKERFDYIFYTGSTKIGKVVRAAANEFLTPVTLELGGKSPLYIDDTVNMTFAARRIMWGKCLNSGQTCIAPDYILCTREVQENFIAAAKKVITQFFGDKPLESPDLCCIINEGHFKRLTKLLSESNKALGGEIIENERLIAPTIVTNVKKNDPILKEEIFGPILPIYNVSDVNEAISFINERELPLACYVFSQNKDAQNLFINNTSSGSLCINDTVTQGVVDGLPFGGVGHSGIGAYHGKYSFDTFTHKKSCFIKGYNAFAEFLWSKRYPPYNDKKLRMLSKFLGIRLTFQWKWPIYFFIFMLGLILGQQITFWSMILKQ